VRNVIGSHHLTSTVHRELRSTDINRTEAARAQHRTDGRAAERVVADDKLLDRNAISASKLSHKEARYRRCGVSLIGVVLDDDTSVNCRGMAILVLLAVSSNE